MVLRDLKHLIFFEDLLQDANNALVQAACAEGRHALAYNCSKSCWTSRAVSA